MTFGETFNEGLGHGGFSANLVNGSGGIAVTAAYFNPVNFSPDVALMVLEGPTGVAVQKAAVQRDLSGSATLQLEPDNSGNPVFAESGMRFVDPFYNYTWWIVQASPAFASGTHWKQEVSFTKVTTPSFNL